MAKLTPFRRILLTAAVILNFTIWFLITRQTYHPWYVIGWIDSVFLIIFTYVPDDFRIKIPRFNLINSAVIIFIIALPLVVRVINYSPQRFHGDDLVSAYFSVHYHPLTTNFFSGLPGNGQWVCNFPVIYFLIQKIFLKFTGDTILAVKLSVLPYVAITSIFLFLITKMTTNRITGIISVILYSFLAFSLYLETLGLHFIASTAVFLIFLYLLLKTLKTDKPLGAILTGIFCGLCYMFYSSSYIAFPVFFTVYLIRFIIKPSLITIKIALIITTGFLIFISPFAGYALTTENYFTQRTDEVLLLTGNWSPVKNKAKSLNGSIQVVKDNLQVSYKSLITDGIGGHGGYTFNRQAMFDPVARILIVAGLIAALILLTRRVEIIIIIGIIVLTFATGMVLTIPPPAYHRLSLIIPLLSMIMALPFYYLRKFVPFKIFLIITSAMLIIYSITNEMYFKRSIKDEIINPDIPLANYINLKLPNRHWHVVAYSSCGLEKVYYFFGGKTELSIDSNYVQSYEKYFPLSEKYVLIVPDNPDLAKRVQVGNPGSQLFKFSDIYTLVFN
jgi:hypothetical protein